MPNYKTHLQQCTCSMLRRSEATTVEQLNKAIECLCHRELAEMSGVSEDGQVIYALTEVGFERAQAKTLWT